MSSQIDLNKIDRRFAFAAERQRQRVAGHGVSSMGGAYAYGYYPCHIAGGIALHAREQLP